MTSCTGSVRGGFWEIWKKVRVESCGPKKKSDFRLLAEALWRVPHVLGEQMEKPALCLSPYVEKPLNSKVIKSFVPELRSRKCFSSFGIPMFYVYMRYEHYVHFTNVGIYFERLVQAMEGVRENKRPPEKRKKKNAQHRKQEGKNVALQPEKEKKKKKKNSSTPREDKKDMKKRKEKKRRRAANEKKRLHPAKSRKKARKEKKKKKEDICSLYFLCHRLICE